MNQKIEGYWYSEYHPEYPKPIPNVLSQEEADKIYDLIVAKEKEAELHHYRGFSKSRIDDSIVGSQEFETKKWRWPKGFAEHYVKKYRVKPSDEFLAYIGYTESRYKVE